MPTHRRIRRQRLRKKKLRRRRFAEQTRHLLAHVVAKRATDPRRLTGRT